MKRIIFASHETEGVAKTSTGHIVKVYSFFPCDKAGCECQKMIYDWKQKLGKASPDERQKMVEATPFIECSRDKKGLTRFEIICKECGERQGLCWATDASLKDWCDFHYIQWTKGVNWRGCFTPHISPITQELCFECCCGNDTRDFRANMTMNQTQAEKIEAKNAIGRGFNKSDSKFLVRKIGKKVVI